MHDAEPVRLDERAAGIRDDGERERLGQPAEPTYERAATLPPGDQLEHEIV